MSIPALSVRNRVFVNLLFLICSLLGLFAWQTTIVDVYPDVSFDQASIVVIWPGASPEEVEQGITRKIEEEILDTRGVSRIVSSSERDRTLIDVKFSEEISDAEFDAGFDELRARVQRVGDLPDDAEEPIVTKVSVNELYPLVQVVVGSDGNVPLLTLRAVAWNLREKLRRVDGVQRVSDLGIPELEWRVMIRREGLESAGLTLLEVAETLQARHRNIPAGTTAGGNGEMAISATGEFTRKEDLLDAVVGQRPDASPVLLREIAEVRTGLERLKFLNRYNGRPCINLSIAKEKESDSVEVRDALLAAIALFNERESLPDGVHVTTSIDTTKILTSRIRVLVDNLAFGIVLVFLVLWLFIGARNSILAVIGIPFSFLLAFAVLQQFGLTVNAITLFSLMLVSGMVVDDAIVVLENIYRRIEDGLELTEAVIKGTEEVFWPVLISSITTVAAFLPMLLMAGVTGEFMSIIPKTVIAVLIASLLECLIILPAHYLHLGSRKSKGKFGMKVQGIMGKAERVYLRTLNPAIRFPWMVLLIVACLTGVAIKLATTLPINLFPSDFQAFFANVYTDSENGLQTTSEALKEVEAIVSEYVPEQVESFTTSVGVTMTDDNQILLKPSVGQLLVFVKESPDVDSGEVIREIRRRVEPLLNGSTEHSFLRIKVDEFQDGPPTGKPVAVRVAGPDYGNNDAVAREVKDFLRTLPGVFGVSSNLDEGPREMRVVPDTVRLARAGIPFSAVASTVFVANEGLDAGDLLPEGTDKEVTLRIQLREEDRQAVGDLMLLKARSPSGRAIPLSEVARQEATRGPAALYHYDGDRVVLVTADVDTTKTDSTRVNRALMKHFADVEQKHPGISLTFGGEFEETQKSFDSLKQSFVVAVILIFTILAAMFRSYSLPWVVMSVVPFSFVGVVLGLCLLGFPFTIMAFIAIVGLSGVVVNDSLVLLDFIVRKHRETGDCLEAVRHGCQRRMRAVLLTTITTVFGLLPMALGLTGTSRIWSPFAATITFGLGLAMFLTLFLVPAVYMIMYRNRGAPKAG